MAMVLLFIAMIVVPAFALLLFFVVTRVGNPTQAADVRKKEKKNGKGKSVQKFFDFEAFTNLGVISKTGTLAIFEITPNNLTVLPEHVIADQIWHLQMLLQQNGDLEILCTDGADTGEENLRFLRRRIAEETNDKIRELLRKDLETFENAHLVNTSIRQFYLVLRMQKLSEEQQLRRIDELARMVREHNLTARLLTSGEVRHMLGIYYIGYMYAEKWKEEDYYETEADSRTRDLGTAGAEDGREPEQGGKLEGKIAPTEEAESASGEKGRKSAKEAL